MLSVMVFWMARKVVLERALDLACAYLVRQLDQRTLDAILGLPIYEEHAELLRLRLLELIGEDYDYGSVPSE